MKLWEIVWGWGMWGGGVLTGWLLHAWRRARSDRMDRERAHQHAERADRIGGAT